LTCFRCWRHTEPCYAGSLKQQKLERTDLSKKEVISTKSDRYLTA
jgi:hypothetical protein